MRCLNLHDGKLFISSFDRPNITYQVSKKTTKEKDFHRLVDFINTNYSGENGIIYCLSRKSVEETADQLVRKGFNAYPYHAGMSQKYREEIQDRFNQEENIIICATIAFGMGIDKPNIRFVAHLDMPKCLESYYQETGRAGRDGLPSTAWMVYGARDLVLLKRITERGVKDQARRRVNNEKLDAILGFCENNFLSSRKSINLF